MVSNLFSHLRNFLRPAIGEKRLLAAVLAAAVCLVGCGGAPSSTNLFAPPPPVTPTTPTINTAVTAKNIYSIDLSDQTVDVYAANLNGTASPTSSYAGGALAVTGDSTGNVYIGTYSSTTAAVEVYAPGAMTASRTITVATATVNAPQINTLGVDSVGNLYVAISGSIVVYGPGATGSATPIRTLAGALTMLTPAPPTQLAFDASDNLFVATGSGYKGSQVIEFAAGVSGNVAPTVITSADYFPSGVTLDTTGNIYIVQGSAPSSGNGAYLPAINVFPKGSVAGATPSRTISGSNIGIAIYTDQIFVDSGGNIFVGATLNGQTDFLVYSATATGNVAPASTLVRSQGSTTDSQFYVK
jgi:hypothetical protein